MKTSSIVFEGLDDLTMKLMCDSSVVGTRPSREKAVGFLLEMTNITCNEFQSLAGPL